MRTILLVTDEEASLIEEKRGRTKEALAASMIIRESDGRVLKSASSFIAFNVDVEKLESVLNGARRVTRKKADG